MMLERGRYPLALNGRLPVLRVAGVVLLTRLSQFVWLARDFRPPPQHTQKVRVLPAAHKLCCERCLPAERQARKVQASAVAVYCDPARSSGL
jgi:hypothetical protein